MKTERIDGGNSLRAVRIKELYAKNWARINEAALESNKHLTAADAYECVARLAGKLQYYPERFKLTDDQFVSWSLNILEAGIFAAAMRTECKPFIHKAIYNVLATCSDLGVDSGTAEEVAQDVWVWAWLNLDLLMRPSPTGAKLTSRLYARARWQARAWKTARLIERARFADMDEFDALERKYHAGGRTSPSPTLSV